MNTLKFNEADLAANREGRLSDAQQKRIDADLAMIQRHSKYMLWVFGAIFAVMVSAALFNQLLTSGNMAELGMIVGSFTLIIGFVFLFSWSSNRSLRQRIIHTAEGTADIISTFTTVKGMRVPLNRLRLRRSWYSTLTFHFQDAQSLRYFKNGKRYRVYYLPYAMPQALSAEEIEPEKAKNKAKKNSGEAA